MPIGFRPLLIGQQPSLSPFTTPGELQLETITESNEDVEPEDDSFLQAMRLFLRSPVNLNEADAAMLKELLVLSPLQIDQILSYRRLLGNFLHLYELQAVPGLDIPTIERIRPYITVATPQPLYASMRERLKGGRSTLLARVSQVLETQKGFLVEGRTANFYPGSRQRIYCRYKYQFKNLLQFGFLGDKDAGEQFFKGAQKMGFDFYSAHLFVRNIGIVKSLAIGDFAVNFGQGLTQWQRLAFKKGTEVTNVKRQLQGIHPYNSAGEINFHRGIGLTVNTRNIEATVFVSFRKVDGNVVTDPLEEDGVISSLQTSGLHRTKSEVADKGSQGQFTVGASIGYNYKNLHVGINGVRYQFQRPIKKADELYNLYALSGREFGNYSFDYSYTFKNCHFFGEAAFTARFDKAFVNGIIISLDQRTDISILHRSIAPGYQALYSNAFTENSTPTNERGIFAGITFRPRSSWRLDAYVDFYKFPWLKYLVDAPSVGRDFMLQLLYKPNKRLEAYARYRAEVKAKNSSVEALTTSPVVAKPRRNIRSQVNYKCSPMLTLRSRLEFIWFDVIGPGAQKGYLTYADALFKPLMKPYGATIRLQYFATDGYDSRMYAYENDALYSYAIPVFYDKGIRYYLNLSYDFSKKLTGWFRWAQTIYTNKQVIGSGLDQIEGNKRTDVKVQVMYEF